MVNEIKFSHKYPKLWGQTSAILMNIYIMGTEELSDNMIVYDTKISDGNYYKLPKGKVIVLYFHGGDGIPFTTIRRYTEMKFKYYQSKLREEFNIRITGDV